MAKNRNYKSVGMVDGLFMVEGTDTATGLVCQGQGASDHLARMDAGRRLTAALKASQVQTVVQPVQAIQPAQDAEYQEFLAWKAQRTAPVTQPEKTPVVRPDTNWNTWSLLWDQVRKPLKGLDATEFKRQATANCIAAGIVSPYVRDDNGRLWRHYVNARRNAERFGIASNG